MKSSDCVSAPGILNFNSEASMGLYLSVNLFHSSKIFFPKIKVSFIGVGIGFQTKINCILRRVPVFLHFADSKKFPVTLFGISEWERVLFRYSFIFSTSHKIQLEPGI